MVEVKGTTDTETAYMHYLISSPVLFSSSEWPWPKLACVENWYGFAQQLLTYGLKGKGMQDKGYDIVKSTVRLYCWVSIGNLKVVLLLDFAVSDTTSL